MENPLPSPARAAALALVLSLAAAPLAAQFRAAPMPTGRGNAELAGLKVGQIIGDLEDDVGEAEEAWCTSYLPAEGARPAVPYPDPKDPEEQSENDAVYLGWAMMYGPGKLRDGDSATAWAESAMGDGVGEAFALPLDATRPIQIMNGFQRSAKLFQSNARAHRVRVSVLVADMDPGQFGTFYMWPTVAAQREVELRDAMGWQALPLPAFDASLLEPAQDQSLPRGTIVVVEILSAYPGDKYQDLCVSGAREVE